MLVIFDSIIAYVHVSFLFTVMQVYIISKVKHYKTKYHKSKILAKYVSR